MLAAEHPGVDRLIRGLGDSLRGQPVEQFGRVIKGQRLAKHRGHPDQLDRPRRQCPQLALDRADELARQALRIGAASLRMPQPADQLNRQERVTARLLQHLPGRGPGQDAEPVMGDGDDVAVRQRAELESAQRRVAGRPGQERQVRGTRGGQPRHRRVGEPARQRAQHERTQVIQPLRVVDREDDHALDGALLQRGGHRVQQPQRLAGQGRQRFRRLGRQDRIGAVAHPGQQRAAGNDPADPVRPQGPARGAHPPGLPQHGGKQSGLADAGLSGDDQTVPLAGPDDLADDAEGGSHRLGSPPQHHVGHDRASKPHPTSMVGYGDLARPHLNR